VSMPDGFRQWSSANSPSPADERMGWPPEVWAAIKSAYRDAYRRGYTAGRSKVLTDLPTEAAALIAALEAAP